MGILQRSVRTRAKDFMLVLDLKKVQLIMTNSLHWYSHVLSGNDDRVLSS